MSILADFQRLAEFSGREPRREFWPYVGIVYLADVIIGQFAMIPIVTRLVRVIQARPAGSATAAWVPRIASRPEDDERTG